MSSNIGGGQFRNAGFQFGAGKFGFGSPSNNPQLGPDGPNSAASISSKLSPQDNYLPQIVQPSPTIDDAARAAPFNLTNENLAAIQDQAEFPLKLQEGIREVIPPIVERLLPGGSLIGGAFDALNHQLNEIEPEREAEVYRDALFRAMNNSMVQSAVGQAAPQMRGFFKR